MPYVVEVPGATITYDDDGNVVSVVANDIPADLPPPEPVPIPQRLAAYRAAVVDALTLGDVQAAAEAYL